MDPSTLFYLPGFEALGRGRLVMFMFGTCSETYRVVTINIYHILPSCLSRRGLLLYVELESTPELKVLPTACTLGLLQKQIPTACSIFENFV
jgi:hypothetical protein